MATPSTDSKFTETTSVQHALDFDSVTPSTADLPTDHFKTITSAPRPTKVQQHNLFLHADNCMSVYMYMYRIRKEKNAA